MSRGAREEDPVGGPIAVRLRRCVMLAVLLLSLVMAMRVPALRAQDLAPRAYVVTPVGSNAVTVTNSFNDGSLLFEGTVPITDSTGKLDLLSATYYHAFGLFGRSANFAAVLPYGFGTFEGTVSGVQESTDRSGFFDATFRFSANLMGGQARSLAEFRQWRQKHLLGVSLKIVVPTGQYDPTKLLNLGSNRWSFKPEVGYSHRWNRWLLDTYGSVSLFTKNPEFFSNNDYVPGTQSQTQDPIWALQLHLSYDLKPRLWFSFDANFWYGGRTSLNGVENPETLQQNSRVGFTGSIPLTRHQSLKVGYAQGAYIRFGGDFRIYSVAWQYSWIGRPW